MTSPTRFPRTAPPRKPLHERSDSHTNERTSPTLRIIGDPDAQIYTSSPFPTLPSHILQPKNRRNSSQPVVYEDEGGLSDDGGDYGPDHETHTMPTTSIAKGKGVLWVEDYNGAASQFPSAEPSRYSSSPRNSSTAGNQLPSTSRPDVEANDSPTAATRWDFGCDCTSDEIVQLPTVPGRGEALGSHRFTHDFNGTRAPQTMPSDTSLSSNESTGTVIRTKPQSRPSRGSYYSALPVANRPASSISDYTSNPARSDDESAVSSSSPKSPDPRSYSPPDLHRISSTSTAERVEAPAQSGANLQYPVVHPPTVSGSWAESIPSALTRPPRAASSDRWNPHLSTVHSEDTDSRSGTMSGSGRYSISRNTSNDPDMPAPLRVIRRSRDFSGSTIRIINERDDNLTALPPIPGSRDSTFEPSRASLRSNRRNNTLQPRPSTRGSFLRDSIPAWARIYYARHDSSTENVSSRPPTRASISSENHFTGSTRPRNRPHPNNNHDRNRNSLTITPIENNNTVIAEVRGEPRRKVSQVWSPHLWHDRSCMGKRRTVFKAPSIDERAESNGLNRRNVQIFMFMLGFIFPFAWFIASFLPLPPKPVSNSKVPQRRLSRLELARDLEMALGHVDGARYENARWWRNLNRWMSLLGVLILAAMIALAVVAVHIKK